MIAFAALPAMIAKAILTLLLAIMGILVTRILFSLSIGLMVFGGMNLTLDWMMSQALAHLKGLPADVLGILSTLNVGVCLSMYSSAVAIRAVLTWSPTDTIKKMVFI